MRNDFYPNGSITALLQTDLVTAKTKQVLKARLDKPVVNEPAYFTNSQFETLKAVCMRLIPQAGREQTVDLPGLLEEQLLTGSGNGWRYASMPADMQAILLGLRGIDETSITLYGKKFDVLEVSQQDEILQTVQDGTTTGNTWEHLSSSLFFEELLARLVEIYYSHPLGKEEIGDISIADAKGWDNIGLDQSERHELFPITSINIRPIGNNADE